MKDRIHVVTPRLERVPSYVCNEHIRFAQKRFRYDTDRRQNGLLRGCWVSPEGEKGVHMYKFPAHPDRKKIWLAKVIRLYWQPGKHAFLCGVSKLPKYLDKTIYGTLLL